MLRYSRARPALRRPLLRSLDVERMAATRAKSATSASTSSPGTRDRRILRHPVQVLPARAHRSARTTSTRSLPRWASQPFTSGHDRQHDRQVGQERRGCAHTRPNPSPDSASTTSKQARSTGRKFDARKPGQASKLTQEEQLRPHQKAALEDVIAEACQDADRGKLIMACGTGKTFTALKIAETHGHPSEAHVLFLVPSLSLLSQTLREWTAEATNPIHEPRRLLRRQHRQAPHEGRRRRRRNHDPRPRLPRHDQRQATRRAVRRPAKRGEEDEGVAADDGGLLDLPVDRRRRQSAEGGPASLRPHHLRRSPPHHRRHALRRG